MIEQAASLRRVEASTWARHMLLVVARHTIEVDNIDSKGKNTSIEEAPKGLVHPPGPVTLSGGSGHTVEP